ncbi:MAG: patatin-like phospholipase family protein [Thermovirgaceae bacterium]|nr:patatin-like phospholipase family protein [Thermovirgaceae bacterium]
MRRGFLRGLVFIMLFFALASSIEAGGVVLVLSGGGTRGLAHIGVLKVIEERGIEIRGIVGTSIGSLVGGLSACGYSALEIESMLGNLDLTSLLYDKQSEADSPPGEESAVSSQSLVRLEFDIRGHLTGPLGGLSGSRLLDKLQDWTSRNPVLDFADLPVPFAAVATDLVTGEAVILRRGNLASAIRASMAIPGLFSPWTVDGRLLVDGGLVSNAPVLIAQDLFPGYPVILVDVTGRGKERENIRTVVDVVDQMITIMTLRNVQEELKFADLVITPKVGGLPMLDVAGHDEIVLAGEIAARASIGNIEEIAARTASAPPREPGSSFLVADVRVHGMGESLSQDIRKRYSDWIGRTANAEEIIEACVVLRDRDDVRTADFTIEFLPDGSAVVVLNVEKEPTWEVVAGGYATNLNPYAAVYLDVARRDLFTEGDLLSTHLGIGERWQITSRYLSPVQEGRIRWELRSKAGKRIHSPLGAADVDWEQYSMGASGYFYRGSFMASLGYAGEIVRFEGQDHTFSGPTMVLAWEGLDDAVDPTEGVSASLSVWWRDASSLFARMRFFGVTTIGDDWRLFTRGGAISGDDSSAYHAAYLGARDELFSRASNPLKADNAAWAGIGVRRVFLKSWWGTINLDLFATAGQTYDSSWTSQERVWETGLALSLPGRVFDGKILVLYDDRSEWTFGFTIGRPSWEDDPLP